MPALAALLRRDDLTSSTTIANLLIALLTLAIVAVVASLALLAARCVRSRRTSSLPALPPSEKPGLLAPPVRPSKRGHRRTLSITTAPSHHDLQPAAFGLEAEKAAFMGSPTTAPPRAGLPEIHITFPDEERDSNEKRHSGRVVVVRISDNGGIGLAPYLESKEGEGLPPYERGEFMSLDLTRLGGLREKEQVWA